MRKKLVVASMLLIVLPLIHCGGGSQAALALPITVLVTPPAATVQPGTTAQFSATVSRDSKNKGVTWTVSCSTSPCGTVSPATTASGAAVIYTAPAAQPGGSLSVGLRATSVTDTSASIAATITVPGLEVSVASDSATVQASATAQFTATVTNDMANKGVTWSVSCSTTPCGTISPVATASGVATTYTAPPNPPPSDLDVIVTATSVSNTATSATAIVTVLAITISQLAPAGVLLPLNVTQEYTATINNDPTNAGVSWTLTQSGVACSPGCGTASPSITANGGSVSYAAPANAPVNATVTLTGASVADSTKSVAATINISAGVVKLVPNIITFGTLVVGHSSSALTATLTNTGTTALSVTSFKIAGDIPTDFFQSNTCGGSVGAESSCTIGVTFTPTGRGTRNASIFISDSSHDSPQQINLSGVGVTEESGAEEVPGASLRSALTAHHTVAVPKPSGTNEVGTHTLDLVDSSRVDPYVVNGTKRELLVRFWYPATLNQSCQVAEYTSPKVWGYFSQIVGVPLPEVETNSCEDALVADGPHPVVVFTPGYTATFTDYTFLFEDLASRGYVVASIDHTYEATAVEFPDGRFIKSVFGSHLGGGLRGDDQAVSFATTVRLQDLKFVLNELHRLNAEVKGTFTGKLDTSRIAIAGHSMGGSTAILALEQEPRFRAGIVIDGFVPDDLIKPTQTPVLILSAGRGQRSDSECQLWNSLRGPRLLVNLTGAEHIAPSDAVWLAQNAIQTGSMGPEKTEAAVREYIAAFLDANLRDLVPSSIWTGPSADYSDVEVTTQQQSVCTQP